MGIVDDIKKNVLATFSDSGARCIITLEVLGKNRMDKDILIYTIQSVYEDKVKEEILEIMQKYGKLEALQNQVTKISFEVIDR